MVLAEPAIPESRSVTPKLAFVYSGYGAQASNTRHLLFREEPAFREGVEQCAALVDKEFGAKLRRRFEEPNDSGSGTNVQEEQLDLLALQVGLTRLWRSLGLEPDAVVGHSIGEIAAAWAAGCLPLSSAIHIAFHMGRLLQQVASQSPDGAMVAVQISMAQAMDHINRVQAESLSIAAHNGPRTVVISGRRACCERLTEYLTKQHTSHRLVSVPGAGHSRDLDCILDELKNVADTIRAKQRIPIYSSVTGKSIPGEHFNGRYWAQNVRQTVQFAHAVEAMRDDGYNVFLEINSHPLLLRAIRDCFNAKNRPVHVLATLEQRRNPRAAISSAHEQLSFLGFSLAPRSA